MATVLFQGLSVSTDITVIFLLLHVHLMHSYNRDSIIEIILHLWNKAWSYLINSYFNVLIVCKASACNAGDLGSIPGLGRSPGEGNGNPLQYACLENPMDYQRSLVVYSPWGREELDTTEQLHSLTQ